MDLVGDKARAVPRGVELGLGRAVGNNDSNLLDVMNRNENKIEINRCMVRLVGFS